VNYCINQSKVVALNRLGSKLLPSITIIQHAVGLAS